MSTADSINKVLENQTATHGWDVLVAYNRARINMILQQQYIEKIKAGEHYEPFNHETDTTSTGYHFKNLILGPPLISFEDSTIQDSRVTVRLMFTGGSFIRTDSHGQVVQWDRYTPASQYGLKINIELKYGFGKVTEEGKIILDFTQGQIYEIEGLNDLPADIIQAFQDLLRNNSINYVIGELKHDDKQEKLYPTEFVVRTQRYPGSSNLLSSSNKDGAVLVFIKTEYGGKGTLPVSNDSQPWVIPEGKTAALLISEKLLYGPLLIDGFTSRIADLKWKSSLNDGRYSLNFTDGYVPTTSVISQNYAGLGFNGWMNSSDRNKNKRPARLSMAGFELKKSNDFKCILGTFIEKHFTDTFEDIGVAPVQGGGSWDDIVDVKFTREGQFKATLGLDSDSNIIFTGNADFKISSTHSHWGAFVGKDASQVFAREASANLNKDNMWNLNSIKTFYLRSVLFPGDNILSFSEVYNPGDLALYGDVAQSLKALTVSPEEAVIACGQTLQFSASLEDGNVPQGLVWSVDGVGRIDRNGLYYAPNSGEITQTKNVIVTATTRDGIKNSSIITVLISALEIEPAFILIKESDAKPIEFKAHQVGFNKQNVTWALDADISNAGSVDANGIYTPPAAGKYSANDLGLISIIASLPSGQQCRSIICLCGHEIEQGFTATPAYALNVIENSTVGFSAQNRHFDADCWKLYPQSGKLSEPRKLQSADKMRIWACDYRPPKLVTRPELELIHITQAEPEGIAGYSLVELQPALSAWSRVTALSTLEISTVGSSTGATEIYGNGLNQATMQIKIMAQNEKEETVILPAEDIIPYITLVDYYSGEEISDGNVWAYTDKINEYNTSLTTLQSDSTVVAIYVTAKQGAITKDIAVKVRLINANADREYYSTAYDASFGLDSKVTVKTLQPINYSNKENISYGSAAPVKIKEDLRFSVISGNSYQSKTSGECYVCPVEIVPSNQHNTTFKYINVNYTPVINETVNTSAQSWGVIKNELSFSCLPSELTNKSCSVSGYKASSGSTEESTLKSSAMIFFDARQFGVKSFIDLNGVIYFHDGDTKYRIEVNSIPEFPSSSSNVTFIGYMFQIPDAELKPLGWKNSMNDVNVEVIDNYGNSGEFRLHWDDNQHYLTPAII